MRLAVEDPQRDCGRAGRGCLRSDPRDARRNARAARRATRARVAGSPSVFNLHTTLPPTPSSASNCDGEAQHLDIGLRLGRAEDFGVELVELPEAALLRALVAEGRAVGRDLERRKLLPALGQIGARDSRGEFGPQGDAVARAILEACTFPWTRRRWSRPASGRTPRSARAPAPRPGGSRTGGGRARRSRRHARSGRLLRQGATACRGRVGGC